MPTDLTVGGLRLHELRYGENPHQRGALYAIPGPGGGAAHARALQGSALSYTNWLDVDAARALVSDFAEPAACVIKHTNPCGFAVGIDAADAYRRAYECDPRSAFGGIVALNRPLDDATAEELARTFLEAVVVPAITSEATIRLAARPRLRVLVVERPSCAAQLDVRSVDGGLLVQTIDRVSTDRAAMRVVSSAQPDQAQWRDLLVAWRVCRHVKSNAIVIVRDGMAVGVGAGQQHPRAQQLQQQARSGRTAHLGEPGVHDLAVAGERGRPEPPAADQQAATANRGPRRTAWPGVAALRARDRGLVPAGVVWQPPVSGFVGFRGVVRQDARWAAKQQSAEGELANQLRIEGRPGE